MNWDGKPYHSLDYELKERFGEKVYKLSLNGGMTCPNRDGTLGSRGCIFCSEGGSGDFAGTACQPVSQQMEAQKILLQNKPPVQKYIAYFQAYTNTYAPLPYLRQIFTEAITPPEIAALSIATRPDCLSPEVLDLLEELNRIKPVWVELGLQTIHPETAAFIRRGYPLSCFEASLARLRARHLEVIVHTILGLPGEGEDEMLETVDYLGHQDIQGIKLQLLHILKNTDLAEYYQAHPFSVLALDEYIRLIIRCLEILPPDMVIHRLTGDGPRDLLLAPLWSLDKRRVLNTLHKELKKQGSWQGRFYQKEVSYV
ncbi:MAG: TIGR01212 family radical SAM protein [Lachnospiraceae bacterium]|nr:TIGR01212 family radical SAM protein [Lachnospiraceae bacterium]